MCRLCDRVLKTLRAAGHEPTIIDVTQDDRAYDYVTRQLGASSVPVVVYNDHVMLGYDHRRIAELLERIERDRN